VVLGGGVLMSEAPLYPSSGQGAILDPQQIVGPYVCPTKEHIGYSGASLIRNSPRPRATIGPQGWSYFRVLRGGRFYYERGTPVLAT